VQNHNKLLINENENLKKISFDHSNEVANLRGKRVKVLNIYLKNINYVILLGNTIDSA